MNKQLIRAALGLMGVISILSMGVVNAVTTISEPYGHIEYTLNGNEEYEAQVITITDNDGTIITILDRNLGATEAGIGCEGRNCSNGHGAYGYHFQWGNNYGFKGTGNLPAEQVSTTQVSASSITYNPLQQQYYSNGTFIKWSVNWLDDDSKVDLWGGSIDDNVYDIDSDTRQINNPADRRGPCPENFHVPSKGERDKIKNMVGNNINEIHNKLLIPFAALRDNGGNQSYNLGSYAGLWSSSPYSVNDPYSRSLEVDNNNDSLGIVYMSRANAYSLRCLYDSYQAFNSSLILSFTGSKGGSISTGNIEVERGNSISRDDETGNVTVSGMVVATGIADEGYVFSGWLTDCSGNTVTTSCNFTGLFKPITYTIAFDGNATDVVGTQESINATYDIGYNAPESSFTRNGYDFSLWNTQADGNGTIYNTGAELKNLTTTGVETITLYAQWTPKEYKVTWNDHEGYYSGATYHYGAELVVPTNPAGYEDDTYTYVFSGWTPEVASTVTANVEYTAEYTPTYKEYKVTWNDHNGEYASGTYHYGAELVVPTNPAGYEDDTYTYAFSGWTPEVASTVTANVEYTAEYTPTYKEYKVNIVSNNTNSGTVSTGLITVPYGTVVGTLSGNPITVGGEQIEATPNTDTIQWDYEFENWTHNCGATVTTGCIITANFRSTVRKYTITWLDDEDEIIDTTEVEYGVVPTHADVSKAANAQYTYTFDKWTPTAVSVIGPATYKAIFTSTVNQYQITFNSNGGSAVASQTKYYGETVDIPSDPMKNGYNFSGWYSNGGLTNKYDFTEIVTGQLTLYAKWTKIETNPSGGYSGGGRRNESSDTKNSQSDEQISVESQNDENTENIIQSDSEESGNTPTDSSVNISERQEILSPSYSSFTKEQNDAYKFAKENGIITMLTIEDVDMEGSLTRIAMAKMLSYYAINVLGQKPNKTRINKFKDVSERLDSEYDNGVTLAYQLGIMGINMSNNRFRPNDEVTRAEFATALSRMLYSTLDGEYKATSKYYLNHMKKLKEEKIITYDNPNMKELRGYVMIMLMRSAK